MDQSPSFADFSLDAGLAATLNQLGWEKPTPIQVLALPAALEGRDLRAQAGTGSGKTAVFALSLLSRLNLRYFGAQAVVLCPTRELADQGASAIRQIGRSKDHLKVVSLCGGVPIRGQIESLSHGAHVIVGTPGRILDHLRRGTLKLEGLRTLVFDEADRMLEMGFIDDMSEIARSCPGSRQTLLFSATYPPGIEDLARPFLVDPVSVSVAPSEGDSKIDQRFYEVTNETRLAGLEALLAHHCPERCLVFVNTKAQGREAAAFLRRQGFAARELSGDLEQRDRDETMILFSGRCLSVVVATDVASRGLDIADLDLVVNLDVSPDPEVHVHRVGRTGRGGQAGRAATLVAPHEKGLVSRIEAYPGGHPAQWSPLASLVPSIKQALRPSWAMVKLLDGKKEKLRPGDVLGALTAAAGFLRDQIGAIKITEWGTWIAVKAEISAEVLKVLERTPIKAKVRRAFPVTP